jgi:hypothetical protein
MNSIFMDRGQMPAETDLASALGDTFDLWRELVGFTRALRPDVREEWNFAGAKYGWSFRIRDGKRVLLYLLPRDKFFRAAFVFGQKAFDAILATDISGDIQAEIKNAKAYAEGRGIRIAVQDHAVLEDLKKLIAVKISNEVPATRYPG